MASATGPDQRVSSLEEEKRSPPGVGALSLARPSIPATEEENADGKVHRSRSARIELHARDRGSEREAAGLARGGDERAGADRGPLSGWLYEVLEPHVEELVVAGVRESRGPKSDKRDAFALAEQLRIGSLETRVYKGRGKFGRLGHVARAYGFVVRDRLPRPIPLGRPSRARGTHA